MKVAALKRSVFYYQMLLQSSLCTEKSLYKRTAKGKGEGCGSEMRFLSFPVKLLLQFEYHLSLAYFCNNFNRMVFISKTSRGFAIFCEPLLLCRIFHSCKNVVIKIPLNITEEYKSESISGVRVIKSRALVAGVLSLIHSNYSNFVP